MGNNTERLHGEGGVVTGKREIESKEGPNQPRFQGLSGAGEKETLGTGLGPNDEINEQSKPKYTRQLQSTSSYPEQMNN